MTDINTFLAENMGRIRAQAARRVGWTSEDLEDFVQEACLAITQAMAKFPDRPRSYYLGVSRRAILHVLETDRLWTGMPNQHGKRTIDPMRIRSMRTYLENEDGYGPVLSLPVEEQGYDEAEWATVRPVIDQVARDLPSRGESYREELVEGVAQGASWVELGNDLGKRRLTVAQAWRELRPKMAARLEPYRSMLEAA